MILKDVNDLVTSPIDPLIIASASDDASVRIWSLHSAHKKMPCLAILAGEGHHGGLLSVDFHDTGRYIISGSHDHHINLVGSAKSLHSVALLILFLVDST